MQPKPIINDQPKITHLLIEDPNISKLIKSDLLERMQKGIQTYGTPLQPFNGRDCLQDLYEELLDAVQYARQASIEYPNNNWLIVCMAIAATATEIKQYMLENADKLLVKKKIS